MDKRGHITIFSRNFYVSQCKKFGTGFLLFLRKFLVSKSFVDEKGVSRFPLKKLGLTVPKLFVGIPWMFQKILGIEKFLCITGGITFLSRKFCTSQCWIFLWASLQDFRKFGVLKSFIHYRGYHVFPSQSFCLTVPNYFIGEHCGVSENFFYRKFPCIGGGASRFCQNLLFHRTETKIIVKETFCFPKSFWYRKNIMDKRGHITIFSRNFYVSQCKKFGTGFVGIPWRFQKIWVSKNFMHNRGYYIFPSEILGLTVLKIFVGFPSKFQKFWGIENFYS